MKTHPTQDYYFKRSQERKANKAKAAKRKNTLFTVVVCVIAVSPVIGTLIALMNELQA